MSDPMSNRPVDPPPPPEPPRKSSSPLIWILVLIALIAFAWYFYNRQAGSAPDAGVTAPEATSDAMTPDASTPADDAAKARRAPEAKPPRQVAKAERPASREAVLLTRPRPSYPPEAYRAREEGTVVVAATVDAAGNPSDVSVVRHSGSRVLDRAALAEVRKWKFRPAMKDGKAVASSVQVPVDYKLAEQ
jgi:protein TonB